MLYLPLLVVLLRMKKNFRPLNLIHVSLLVASILEDILRIFIFSLYLPSVFRYCVCSDILGAILSVVTVFFLVYRPFAFLCRAVLQFFVVLGKRKLVDIKVASGMIVPCIGISLIFVASTIMKATKKLFVMIAFAPTVGRKLVLVILSQSSFPLFLSLSFLPLLVSSLCHCGRVPFSRSTTLVEMIS